MSYAIRETVSVTTSTSGASEDFTSVVTGRDHSISYIRTDFDDTVDFTITTEKTLQDVWVVLNTTNSITVAPMQTPHSTTGGALELSSTGGTAFGVPIAVVNERIKIVVASGGDTKTGTFEVLIA